MNGFGAPLGRSTNVLLPNKESLAKLPADARMGKTYKAELAKVATTAKN
jgi:hypothetical protein